MAMASLILFLKNVRIVVFVLTLYTLVVILYKVFGILIINVHRKLLNVRNLSYITLLLCSMSNMHENENPNIHSI